MDMMGHVHVAGLDRLQRQKTDLEAIQVVTGYGVAKVGHMEADLVGAACQGCTAQQAPRPAQAKAVR